MEWTDKTVFGYCPICNGALGDASQSRKKYYTRIVYCIDSIPEKGKHLYAPWDPQPPDSPEMTSSHFYQRFEEEHYHLTGISAIDNTSTEVDECRRWDTRLYRRGNAHWEICYRTIDITRGSKLEYLDKDTLIHCDGIQVVFKRVVLFDNSLDKIINKMRSLLNLI